MLTRLQGAVGNPKNKYRVLSARYSEMCGMRQRRTVSVKPVGDFLLCQRTFYSSCRVVCFRRFVTSGYLERHSEYTMGDLRFTKRVASFHCPYTNSLVWAPVVGKKCGRSWYWLLLWPVPASLLLPNIHSTPLLFGKRDETLGNFSRSFGRSRFNFLP
jgi:hypothetical protein